MAEYIVEKKLVQVMENLTTLGALKLKAVMFMQRKLDVEMS